MYLQALEARSETDALKEEFRGLSEQIHSVKEEILGVKDDIAVNDEILAVKDEIRAVKDEILAVKDEVLAVKEIDEGGQAKQKEAAVEISSPIKEISTEKLKKEPYAILVDWKGSEMSWSPSGNPPLCPVLPSSGVGARLVAIGNQIYKSGGEKALQDCYEATLGQKDWSSLPKLNVSCLT